MPRLLKITLYFFGILLIFLIGLWFLIQTPWFQNKAKNLITEKLSRDLNTEVSIDHIRFVFFNEFSAKNALIRDLEGDTLIFSHVLKCEFSLKDFSNNRKTLKKVHLDDILVNTGIYKGQKELNIQFLIDYFTPPKKDKPSDPDIVKIKNITMKNGRYHYFDQNMKKSSDRTFDETNIVVRGIEGKVKNFVLIKDSIDMQVIQLAATEQSGFRVEKMATHFVLSSQYMIFDELNLKTPYSQLGDYVKFQYSSYRSFSHFVDSVFFDANLNQCAISTNDLGFFETSLFRFKEIIHINGLGSGMINDFSSNNVNFQIHPHIDFKGDIALKNVVDWRNMYLNINAIAMDLNVAKWTKLDPKMPKYITDFEFVNFSGTYNGTFNTFDLEGKANTGIGDLVTQLAFDGSQKFAESYIGEIQLDDFNIGKILGVADFQNVSLNVSIDGKGLEMQYLETNLYGIIDNIDYNKVNYDQITFDGQLKNKLFNGLINIDNIYAKAKIEGSIDYNGLQPKFDIVSACDFIDFQKLKLDSIPSKFSFGGNIHLEGNQLDNIQGKLDLNDIVWSRGGIDYKLENTFLSANLEQLDQKRYEFKVPGFVNIDINGNMLLSEVPFFLKNIGHKLYPTLFDIKFQELLSEKVNIAIDFEKMHPVFSILYPDISFKSGGVVFDYDVNQNIIHSNGKIYDLKITDVGFEDVKFIADTDTSKNLLSFWLNSENLIIQDSIITSDLIAQGYVIDGLLNFDFSTHKDTSIDVILSASAGYISDSLILNITNFALTLNKEDWKLMPTKDPNVVFRNGILELFHFDFRNNNQILFFDAAFGNDEDKINVALNKFNLKTLNPFIASFGFKLDGSANGFIDLSHRNGFSIFESDFVIDNLTLNDDTLGKLAIKTNTGKRPLMVEVDANLSSEFDNEINITGFIDFEDELNPLHLKLVSNNAELHFFEKYTQGLASEIYGSATADVKIFGDFDHPKFIGEIILDDVSFKIDYLQTTYKTSSILKVDEKLIHLSKNPIYDALGNKGFAEGSISHNLFRNFILDIRLDDLKDFQCLNTTRKDNELFYGTAFADGSMRLSGPLDDINMVINARSKRGTQIKIPLDNTESDGTFNYIQFVNLKDDNFFVKEITKVTSGITMDFKFDITQEAEIQLIFDEVLGDVIKGQAEGNIRMEINTYGDFNMYGDISIVKGEYLFTALDVITKKFDVMPGGTISWNGDPYNARLNLAAVKRENPRPSGLMIGLVGPDDLAQYEAPIAVDCILGLKGALFQPEISFDIDFPNAATLTGANYNMFNAVVERVKSDKEELDRQVFALLALGTFIPPGFATENAVVSAGTGLQSSVNNSIGDLISSQISNLLTQIDPRWQVGIDYQGATDALGSELVLSLRRKFLNEKLEFSGSYDAINNTGTRPYNLNLQYNISQSGNLKLSGFQRNANDPSLGNLANVTTTGLGFFFRYEFEEWRFSKTKPPEKISIEEKDREILE